jgi:hypothetical protein
VHN